jgi:ArsR family transcriptional regulator, arsenate/arsenite/antimonite-responsive transcriptional repressor
VDASKILEGSRGICSRRAVGFAALGDPARLAIMRTLQRGTRCVCELAPRLGLAPNLLSYHLRVLRESGLIEGTRRGRRVEYRIRPDGLRELADVVVDLAIGGETRED